MLRAFKRLLRPGGRMAFTTIYPPLGLDRAAARRARLSGPRAVGTRAAYTDLLASAGFTDIEEIDVTAAFITTARAWYDENERYRDVLEPALPPGDFAQRRHERLMQLSAAEDGLLRRGLYSAMRSHAGGR